MKRILRKVLDIVPLILTVIFLSNTTSSGKGIDDTVIAAAQAGLQSFLQSIPPGAEMKYGFHNRQEFVEAIPASPIRIYTVRQDSLLAKGIFGKNFLIPLEEWKVPVTVGEELRAVLTVARVAGKLKVVEMGGAEMAKELAIFDQQHQNKRKILLRLYRLHCDFLVIPPVGGDVAEGDVYPLHSAIVVFPGKGFETKKSTSFQHLLPMIRQKYIEQPGFDLRGHK